MSADRRRGEEEEVAKRTKRVDAEAGPPSREGGPAGERLREFERSRDPQHPTPPPDNESGAPDAEADRAQDHSQP